MKHRSVPVAILVLAACAGAVEVSAVLDVRGGETFVDSLYLYTGSIQPEVFRTREFGGAPGTLDTALVRAQLWPLNITVHWRYEGIGRQPADIESPVSGQWYELEPGTDDNPRIKFVDQGAVQELPGPGVAKLSASPNPFARATFINWQLPPGGRAKVEILDASGRPVRQLASGTGPCGPVAWEGHDESGGRVAAGVYLVRVAAERGSALHKIVLTR